MSVLHTLYYYKRTVKRRTSRCQKVRQGGLLSGGSRDAFSGGGFSGCGLSSVFNPRRSNSMSIISRIVWSSCVRSSENCCASLDLRRRNSDCIFLSAWFIGHSVFVLPILLQAGEKRTYFRLCRALLNFLLQNYR